MLHSIRHERFSLTYPLQPGAMLLPGVDQSGVDFRLRRI